MPETVHPPEMLLLVGLAATGVVVVVVAKLAT